MRSKKTATANLHTVLKTFKLSLKHPSIEKIRLLRLIQDMQYLLEDFKTDQM